MKLVSEYGKREDVQRFVFVCSSGIISHTTIYIQETSGYLERYKRNFITKATQNRSIELYSLKLFAIVFYLIRAKIILVDK